MRFARAAVPAAAVISMAVILAPLAARADEEPAFPGAHHLPFVTNVALAPDGRMFFDEKETGEVRVVEDGKLLPQPFARFDVVPGGESGLLGLALDPNFEKHPWVYVYFTDAQDGRNHLVRVLADGNVAGTQETLLVLLSATGIHNGGDLTFGDDGELYVTVGETGEAPRAQDVNDLGGKVLRLDPDGSVPTDNPFGQDNAAFTIGLRNSFGICADPATGAIWETENGPTEDDEVNRIEAGGNYGWPNHLGTGGAPRYVDPQLVFPQVIVPTGCAVVGRFLYFGDFSGDLHRVSIDGSQLGEQAVVEHLDSGITDVERGGSHDLVVSTSDSIVRLPPIGAYGEATTPSGGAAGGGRPTPTASAGPAQPEGSPAIFWLALILLIGALGAVLFMMRLLSKRVRQVRDRGDPEGFDEYGDRLPPPFE
ncbi:MAG: PQQ-dependent sugar dehydrogenase [Actinomycetota bacterium]